MQSGWRTPELWTPRDKTRPPPRCVLQSADCSYTYIYRGSVCCLLCADGVIAGRFDNAPGLKQRRILLSLSCSQFTRFTVKVTNCKCDWTRHVNINVGRSVCVCVWARVQKCIKSHAPDTVVTIIYGLPSWPFLFVFDFKCDGVRPLATK